jgi:hypothetical protein
MKLVNKKNVCPKWLQLDEDLAREYDTHGFSCNYCRKFIYPCLVHEDYGDYTCFKCEKDVNVVLFCYKCKYRYKYTCDSST